MQPEARLAQAAKRPAREHGRTDEAIVVAMNRRRFLGCATLGIGSLALGRLPRWPEAPAAVGEWIEPELLNGWNNYQLFTSGGICAPIELTYDLPAFATSVKPVKDGLPSFTVERGI